jgi:hypothetical protein
MSRTYDEHDRRWGWLRCRIPVRTDSRSNLDERLRFGNAVAAVVVRRVSCSDAMPYLKELNEFLAFNNRSGSREASVEAPRLEESP